MTQASPHRSLWPQHPIHSPRSAFTLPAYFFPRLWFVFGGLTFWNCVGTGSCSGSLQDVATSSSSWLLLWSFPTLRLSSVSGSSMPGCCRLLRDLRLLCCCLRFSSSCCRCFIFISFSKLLVVVGFTTNQSSAWTELMWYLTPLSDTNSFWHRRHLYFPATKVPYFQERKKEKGKFRNTYLGNG